MRWRRIPLVIWMTVPHSLMIITAQMCWVLSVDWFHWLQCSISWTMTFRCVFVFLLFCFYLCMRTFFFCVVVNFFLHLTRLLFEIESEWSHKRNILFTHRLTDSRILLVGLCVTLFFVLVFLLMSIQVLCVFFSSFSPLFETPTSFGLAINCWAVVNAQKTTKIGEKKPDIKDSRTCTAKLATTTATTIKWKHSSDKTSLSVALNRFTF